MCYSQHARTSVYVQIGVGDTDDLHGRKLGEFVLRERLDEGGFGTVYRCEQPLLEREAVVKVLHQRMLRRDATLQCFVREAQLGSRLDHPYAAHVYAIGVEPTDGLVWIAMELVRGVTLARWLQLRGPMPFEVFVPFFECVAEVVHTAHDRGIIHRDLKPANVMLIERAGRLLPKLLDFGVASLLDEIAAPAWLDSFNPRSGEDPDSTAQLRRPGPKPAAPVAVTPSSALTGTPPYMAPEQWDGGTAVGKAADLYALGVIAYEALTGGRPFRADNEEQFAELHRFAPVPTLGGSLASLDRLFQRALAKRPEDRFASALDFAAALRAELETRMVARIRAAARVWDERDRAPAHLWQGEVFAELERWAARSTRADTLGKCETDFVEACRQRALDQAEAAQRRAQWRRRLGLGAAAAAVAGVFGVFQVRAALEADTERQVARATAIEAEVEQGRAALLHDEMADAEQHLSAAVRRGDRSAATAFMLARATQPRRAEQARFAARAGRSWSATWSPDGARVLTSDDAGALLWDVAARRLVATLDHGDAVMAALLGEDLAITAGNDGTVRLWRASDGAPVRTLRPAAGAPHYFLVARSPDGRSVAAIDASGAAVQVWDVASGGLIGDLRGRGVDFPALGWSSDGRWLLVGGGDDVQVFETSAWKLTLTIPGPIRRVAWDPAGPRIATGTAGGDLALWAVPGGARAAHLRDGGEGIDALAWSRDGELVAAAGRDGGVAVFDARDGVRRSQGNHLHDRVFGLEFDPSGQRIAASSAGGSVAVSDAATGAAISILGGPTKLVRTIHFDLDGDHVLGASWDGTARIWNAAAPYRRWSSPAIVDDCGYVTSAAPDGPIVAVPCRGHTTRIWGTARGDLLAELPETTVLPAIAPHGDAVAIARGSDVEVYAVPGGRLLERRHGASAVTALAFGATGALAGAADGSLEMLGAAGAVKLSPMPAAVTALALLSDGRVVAADARGRVRVGDRELEASASSPVALLRPSPDGARLLGLPEPLSPAAPILWDLASGRQRGALTGHAIGARWVAADRFLTAASDGVVRMWDGTGSLLQQYRGGSLPMVAATLSPDGTLVLGGGTDGRLRYWDAETGRPLWTTPAHSGPLVGLRIEGEEVVTRSLGGELVTWHITAK
jgi:WD40 repeat protein